MYSRQAFICQAALQAHVYVTIRERPHAFGTCYNNVNDSRAHLLHLTAVGLLSQTRVHGVDFHGVQAQDIPQLRQPCKLAAVPLHHHCTRGVGVHNQAIVPTPRLCRCLNYEDRRSDCLSTNNYQSRRSSEPVLHLHQRLWHTTTKKMSGGRWPIYSRIKTQKKT